jgi:predicted kinase
MASCGVPLLSAYIPVPASELPVHNPVCYKRYMRKWMKDRLKRRTKSTGGAKEQANAPEPLQPKYFDSDLPEKSAKAEMHHEAEPEPAAQLEFEPHSRRKAVPPEFEPTADASAESAQRPARRRRRRGGRGTRGSTTRRASAETSPATASPDTEADVTGAQKETRSISPAAAIPIPGASLVGVEPASPDTVAAELRPSAVVPAAPKTTKGTVVLAIGLPGSGKSSWFKRHNIRPLSSDLLRELLFDDAEEQRFQDLVFSNLRAMLRARLIARRPMSYIDATNLNPHERHTWIKLARDYGYDVQGLFFDVPLEVCMERHARRGRVVPEDIMRKMASKLKAPTFDEGFSKITVVRVKKKE